MSNPSPSGVRAGRYLWGGLALVVLVLLGLTLLLSTSSLESAETEARQRAEQSAATVLVDAISPRLASGDIVGSERRDLLELVRARILDDDRVARVRIWRPDGDLIFSTSARDDASRIPTDHLQFSQAAGGVPASVVVQSSGEAGALLQTFAPLRVRDVGDAPYAVAEIDQRYGAIQAEANRFWRPVRIALVVSFAVLVVLFALSFRSDRSARLVAELLPARYEGAGRAAQGASRVPPDVLARIEELETKLEGEVAKGERSAGEAQRLRSALEAQEAELALAGQGPAATEAELAHAADLIEKEKQRAADAEQRAKEAERRAMESADRIAVTESRVSELETALRQAEERAAHTANEAEQAVQAAAEAERAARAAADAERAKRNRESKKAEGLRATQRERNALKKKLAEVEASLADARAKLADGERAAPENVLAGLELQLLRAERDVATADLVRAREELEALREELDEARARAGADGGARDDPSQDP